jgi:hypothetical protein
MIKPRVDGRDDLSFSLAHSYDRAMLAVASGVALGVDIERIAPSMHDDKVAQTFFAVEERRSLAALPLALRAAAFFAVSTRPDELPYLLHIAGGHPAEWSLLDISPDASYSSALAVRCPNVVVHHRVYA